MVAILAGKYELDRRLGVGGMAEVFLGRLLGKDGFSRPVAIKRVFAHLAADDAFARMFVAEAQMCAKLQHPNVVSVLDFDRDDEGRPFLVIELVDGPSLSDLANGGALPTDVALYLTTELLRGLAYAHDLPTDGDVRGIVHRDISPHNVLISWEGAVKVSDFGIAKARAASHATASELLKGKPAYMSPEQANGEALDGRSDLFAVGIVLWELLVGRSLFSGSTTQETLARVLFAPIPSPRSIRADVPADVDAVVMKLLAREKNERYGTANDAIDALIACKDSPRDGRGRLIALFGDRFTRDAPQRVRLDETSRASQARPSPREGRGQSRTRALLLVVAALALTSIAVATTVIVLDRRAPQFAPTPAPVIAIADVSVVDAAVVDEQPSEMTMVVPSVDARMEVARPDRASMPQRAIDAAPRVDVTDAEAIQPTGKGSGDPKSAARALAREEFALFQKRHMYWPLDLPTPKDSKPEDVYAIARREAERLFAKVEDGAMSWSEIRSDGTVDATGESFFAFASVEPEDEWRCLAVKLSFSEARATLEKRECRHGSSRPRCTARELHQRAVARGLPATDTITAANDGTHWSMYDSRGRKKFSIPNDCR